MYDAVDCQGFAGGFTLGTVQAGFRLVGKREHAGGFGVPSCEANRHLLGDAWETQCGDAAEWEPVKVPYVFGNPPCSGFSLLSAKSFRGPDSPINSCMWDFVEFATRCDAQVAVFESVQQAYKQGADLMRSLRADMVARTGYDWHLTHVLHNAYALGGAAVRRRYFFVAHRVPFGVEPVDLPRLPLVADVLGDLLGHGITWNAQPYRRPETWWSRGKRGHAVTCHQTRRDDPAWRRWWDVMSKVGWHQREEVAKVCARYWETYGELPDSWQGLKSYDKLVAQAPNFMMGYNQPFRWPWMAPCRVVTGAGLQSVIHPMEDRRFTHREVLRIQGFPDDWDVRPVADTSGLEYTYGKGIPVEAGRWISTWVRESLDGNPGTVVGEEIGEKERVVDLTNDWKRSPDAPRIDELVRRKACEH